MHNNYFFLQKLTKELNNQLKGKELLTCFSQERNEVVLGFSNELYLKFILRPEFSTLMVINDFSRARRNSVSLWPELYDNKVLEISAFKNERAIKLELENDFVLVAKFFGNRPNLLVFHAEKQTYRFNNRLQTDQNLLLKDFERTFETDFEAFQEDDWKRQYFMLGKETVRRMDQEMEGLSGQEKWTKLGQTIQYLETAPTYIDFSEILPRLSLFEGKKQNSAIEAINNFSIAYLKTSSVDLLKNELTHRIKREQSRTKNYIKKTSKRVKALEEGVKNEEIGHIIMANMHAVEPGTERVELLNFYTNEPIKIKLKKDLSPQKNAEAYYRKSKNEKVEAEVTAGNLKAAENRLKYLNKIEDQVQESDDLKELRTIRKELFNIARPKDDKKLPFNEFVFKGTKIWVGRNAKSNDQLITQYAHKDDIWLHARDVTGSHVLIKDPKPASDVLEFAASLAAFYSKRRSEHLVPVRYTARKYIRKSKKLAAGQVIVDKEETIMVEPSDGKSYQNNVG